jgi:hypothetical protein
MRYVNLDVSSLKTLEGVEFTSQCGAWLLTLSLLKRPQPIVRLLQLHSQNYLIPRFEFHFVLPTHAHQARRICAAPHRMCIDL